MSSTPASNEDLQEIFGNGFDDAHRVEAEQRWGDTDAWRQSQSRTKAYTGEDWEAVKAETEAINATFAAALDAGLPADSPEAMDAAEGHRRQIHERFYALDHAFHVNLAGMYVTDARFTATYDDVRPRLAAFVHDAIVANAARHGVVVGEDGAPTQQP